MSAAGVSTAIWTKLPLKRTAPGRYEGAPTSSLSFPACVVRVRSADDKVTTSGPLLGEALCAAAGLAD